MSGDGGGADPDSDGAAGPTDGAGPGPAGASATILVVGATGTVGRGVCTALAGTDAASGTESSATAEGSVGSAAGSEWNERDQGGLTDASGTDRWLRTYPWPSLPGARVRAATRRPEAVAAEGTVPADEYVDFAFDRPETWGPALADVEGLFLLYPPGGALDPVTEFAAAAVRTGVDRIVFLSTLNAGDLPILPHRRVERRLADLPVRAWSLRAGYFHQNLAEVHADDVRDHDEVFIPAGEARTTFVDARDVAAAAAVRLTETSTAATAQAGSLSIDYLAGHVVQYRDVASALSDALDRPIAYADPSPVQFTRRMRARGHGWGFIGFMLAQYTIAKYRLVPVDRTSDDLRAILGREPVPFADFATDYRPVWRAPAVDD
jgi:uncharacterized protein YbjT (DUF2867 family)